ncbi:hypothetical protein QFZ82_005277 [Streptomyces sp. V4I23]|nr:hypothetical protein [Streptomyces sp. V4I23]
MTYGMTYGMTGRRRECACAEGGGQAGAAGRAP